MGIVFLLVVVNCVLYIFYIHTENIINSDIIFGEFIVEHPTENNSLSKGCNIKKKYIVQEILIKILKGYRETLPDSVTDW